MGAWFEEGGRAGSVSASTSEVLSHAPHTASDLAFMSNDAQVCSRSAQEQHLFGKLNRRAVCRA